MQNETNQTPLELSVPEVTTDTEVVVEQQPSLGLSAAREARRMSVGDAAYALKVSPRVIESLEAGQWSDLPGRTFAVGILRAYGRLLDVSVDAMIDTIPGATPAIKRSASADTAPRASIKPANRRDGETKRQTNRMLKTGLFMVLLAVLLAYAVPGDFWGGAVDDARALYGRLVGGSTTSEASNPNAAVPSATDAQGNPAPATVDASAQTGVGTLELRFDAPAWVEVRDATGRIIYSQLTAAGTTQFITGMAPLDVMVGNAKQVQARWRDEPLKLDKLSGDDVARQILR